MDNQSFDFNTQVPQRLSWGTGRYFSGKDTPNRIVTGNDMGVPAGIAQTSAHYHADCSD